jgi:hypothetical protein
MQGAGTRSVESPSVCHRIGTLRDACTQEEIHSPFSILHFQFSIFNSPLLPTFTSYFILHASSFFELTYVTNNRIINRLLLRAFSVYLHKRV